MRQTLEQRIAAVEALADADPTDPSVVEALAKALAVKTSALVAAAARVAHALELSALAPDLCRAFDRFLADAVRTDKGCHAKLAIARALDAFDGLGAAADDAEQVFLRGLRHVQPEPVWGGRQDTAAPLRGTCALALVNVRHPDTLVDLAALLTDPERAARLAAARAIGCTGDPAGAPLLVYKALIGDAEPEVVAECMTALIALLPERGVTFAGELLRRDDAVLSEAAAVALGGCRRDDAFELLRAWCDEQVMADRRRIAMLAIAMLRSERGLGYLCGRVAHASPDVAAQAVSALSVHRHDPAVERRVKDAASARDDAGTGGRRGDPVTRALADSFG